MTETMLALERIVFIGRTFDEYMDMFALSTEELTGKKILDCPGGACSFTSTGHEQNLDIMAADIAYHFEANELYEKGLQDIDHAMEMMEKAKDNYVWKFFKDVETLKMHRLQALEKGTTDRKKRPERYVPVTLPTLPFEDKSFDMILSAHFLFTYAKDLDYHFHIQTMRELLRVVKEEVRIFPLVDLAGKRYAHLEYCIDLLTREGYHVEEISVAYEFQANANSMLKIRKH